MFHLRKILLAGFLFLVSCQLQAQLKINAAYLEYITQYKDLAIEEMKQYRIPASITLAQGLFESAAVGSPPKQTITLVLSVTTGRDEASLPMTTPWENASEPTTVRNKASMTTAFSCGTTHAMHGFSNFQRPIIAAGRMD